MGNWVTNYGLCYFVYCLETGLFLFVVFSGRWKRLKDVSLYLAALLGSDVLVRPYILHHYGVESRQYANAFYLTDFFIVLAAFMLVCSFFRRACAQELKMWQYLRLGLPAVFVLVGGYTAFSLAGHYDNLFTWFLVEFEQNLYFICLVLNTMLYLLMRQIDSADEELDLLVCGVGIQFAGPAACWALMHLTPAGDLALRFIMPLCTAGMLSTWFYAMTHVPKPASAAEAKGTFPLLAQATAPKI
jgi:hypothetical protein